MTTYNKIKIDGQNPDAILYDPASKRIFTFNGRSKDATVIDAAKGTVGGSADERHGGLQAEVERREFKGTGARNDNAAR